MKDRPLLDENDCAELEIAKPFGLAKRENQFGRNANLLFQSTPSLSAWRNVDPSIWVAKGCARFNPRQALRH
jgi:hypothetical protein